MSNETHDKYEICAAWLKGKDARSANDSSSPYKLVLSEGIPTEAGVYYFHTDNEYYVGETNNLRKRMNQYANAGMVENPVKEYTNRSIQRKINDALKENKSVMLSYCISAVILRNGETFKQLDFKEKYHRTLVESLMASTQPDDQKSWNKQHQKS